MRIEELYSPGRAATARYSERGHTGLMGPSRRIYSLSYLSVTNECQLVHAGPDPIAPWLGTPSATSLDDDSHNCLFMSSPPSSPQAPSYGAKSFTRNDGGQNLLKCRFIITSPQTPAKRRRVQFAGSSSPILDPPNRSWGRPMAPVFGKRNESESVTAADEQERIISYLNGKQAEIRLLNEKEVEIVIPTETSNEIFTADPCLDLIDRLNWIHQTTEAWRFVGCELCFIINGGPEPNHGLDSCEQWPASKHAKRILQWLTTLKIPRYYDVRGACSMCGHGWLVCDEMGQGELARREARSQRSNSGKANLVKEYDAAPDHDGYCRNKPVVRRIIAALCAYDDQILGKALTKMALDHEGIGLTSESQARLWLEQRIRSQDDYWVSRLIYVLDQFIMAYDFPDPENDPVPADGSTATQSLTVLNGYSCTPCRYLTIARDNIVRHWREAGHGIAEERWTEVRLQTWMGGRNHARYWIVRDDSDSNGPSDTANAADARSQSAMDKIIAASQARLKEEDAVRLRKGDMEEDIDRDSPWVKRLGWVRHFCSQDLVSIHDAAQWLQARAATEDDMAEAILDITDHGLSPPQAAQRRGVPRTTLIDRLNGRGAAEDQIQPRRRLSKNQEDRLAFWILRQESLGYAPSHSQIRACVMGLLRQQGEHPDLGRNWVIKFINRRADLKTKMGRRQEAKRFDSFTPKAVHWYFDIRDGQYGWIKPENTVNVDEGGIMTGFGLDSLVVGSADPKRKAFLKGPQTRNWTSFIEAVTADGRALVPGIIFKGKELQKQWFLDEFKQIADWYYITSPNGWIDDHIGIEWLERVYLPQTTPADESDARLIILDGHGSHATDEWMATCFLNNVYCCYLPAHCSHRLQPLYNGVFNALKAAYRRELERFASLTDSAPMDKVNFIRAYAKARRVGMTKKNILPNSGPRVTPEPRPYLGSDDTPQTSRQIRDLGLNKTPKTRRRYNVIAKGFEAQQQTVAVHTARIASLEEELARLKREKKRKAVPNPNKRFMTLGETLAGGEAIAEEETQNMPVVVEGGCSGEPESESEAVSVIEVREETIPRQPTTRSGRLIKRPRIQ
ncbi:hypothetical protein H9L39_17374 [Fusarium oxysporum f. sp. albedinis]|nr:hypothetical protein H9L39_17374 [Fusarium oxysporum f. sp. albedinis]